jgi:hypothetical protein
MSKGKPQRTARATLCVFSTAGLLASLEKEHRAMSTKFKFKPDHPSSLAAEALLLRGLHVYRVARERAKDDARESFHAAALLAGPDVPSYDQLSRRYDDLLDECTTERLESPHAIWS